jgi:hypothetical protein
MNSGERIFLTLFHKLNSLQSYVIVQNYRILHITIQSLSQYNLSISHYRHIQKLRQTK